MRVRVRVKMDVTPPPLHTHAHTYHVNVTFWRSHRYSRLDSDSMNRIRQALKFTFCPGPDRDLPGPKCPTYPMLRRSGCCLQTLSDPLSASSFFPSRTHSEILEGGGTEPPLPSRTSGPTVLFSAQVTWSPARLPRFLCPSFSAQNDARGAPNRDGTSTRLRFGSARFCRAEKCRRKPGARRCEGSGIFQDWRPPPAPRPAHHRGPRSPPAPPHGHSWNCSWTQRFRLYHRVDFIPF